MGFACLACGMLAVSLFGHSFPVVLLGGVLFGIGSGIQQISTIYYISKTVDKKVVTMAISVCVSFISLGRVRVCISFAVLLHTVLPRALQ